jgi:hypothetical protein
MQSEATYVLERTQDYNLRRRTVDSTQSDIPYINGMCEMGLGFDNEIHTDDLR